jgi:hypothetical protein
VPTDGDIRAALPRATLRRMPLALFIRSLMFTVNDGTDSVPFTLEADTEYIPLPRLEALAREMEAVAVEAARDPRRPMTPGNR